MLKKTSRYKLNKLISDTPADNIQFALDVNNKTLNQVHTELKKIATTESFTVIVIPNRSTRGAL